MDGLTPENPIMILCPKCNRHAGMGAGRSDSYCYSCKTYNPYTYIVGRWYFMRTNVSTLCMKYIGAPTCWEWKTGQEWQRIPTI